MARTSEKLTRDGLPAFICVGSLLRRNAWRGYTNEYPCITEQLSEFGVKYL